MNKNVTSNNTKDVAVKKKVIINALLEEVKLLSIKGYIFS